MPSIIDVVASRISRDLTRGKLTETFKPRPTTVKGVVLGKELAMINGTPTTTTLDDSDLVQTVVEFTNIGRPALTVWAPGTSSATATTVSGAASTAVSNPSVPTTRRINTVAPILGGNDLTSDLTISLDPNNIAAETLAAVIVDSTTVNTAIVNAKVEFNVIPQTVDADTIDGYHAADIMAAINAQLPEGTTTGDIMRWDNVALAWVVEHEPIALAGAVMTPLTAAPANPVAGSVYFDATAKRLLVYTDA